MELITWLEQMQKCYQQRNIHTISDLVSLIHSPPESLWRPQHSHAQVKAIEIWLDGCMKIFQYFQDLDHEKLAYQYIELAYARIQSVTANPHSSLELRYWGANKLDRLTILMLECCQTQSDCQQASDQVIELHVAFMSQLGEINMHQPDQSKNSER
ncbi:hypothetical protein [Vibrio rumoiensis]|nr:hypothetical protein [Vibrio rumoiensis]